MKSVKILVGTLVIALALTLMTSVALAEKPPKTVGERVLLVNGEISFQAGKPFHITHGLIGYYELGLPVGNSFGLDRMVLEIDGVERRPKYLDIDWTNYKKEVGWRVVTKLYTFNFPEGMAGTHTFTRRYFLTCQSIQNLGIPMTCDHPAEVIEFTPWEQSLVVTFE